MTDYIPQHYSLLRNHFFKETTSGTLLPFSESASSGRMDKSSGMSSSAFSIYCVFATLRKVFVSRELFYFLHVNHDHSNTKYWANVLKNFQIQLLWRKMIPTIFNCRIMCFPQRKARNLKPFWQIYHTTDVI